jgi:hypothetical protein
MSYNVTVARSKLLKLLTMSVRNLDTSGHIILLQIKQAMPRKTKNIYEKECFPVDLLSLISFLIRSE